MTCKASQNRWNCSHPSPSLLQRLWTSWLASREGDFLLLSHPCIILQWTYGIVCSHGCGDCCDCKAHCRPGTHTISTTADGLWLASPAEGSKLSDIISISTQEWDLMHPTNPFPPRPTLYFVNPLHKNEKNIQLEMTKSCCWQWTSSTCYTIST